MQKLIAADNDESFEKNVDLPDFFNILVRVVKQDVNLKLNSALI